MSSYLMNSPYSDPKFPPTEEYSQGNYIPSHGGDYYTPSHHHHHHPHHQQHPHHQHHAPPSHHHQPTPQHPPPPPHHHHPYAGYPISGPVGYAQENGSPVYGTPPQHFYRPPCGMGPVSPLPRTPVDPTASLSPVPGPPPSQQPQRSPVSSPTPPGILSRSQAPSQPQQQLGGPTSPDCAVSGGNGANQPVIYPWMKKVHVGSSKSRSA